MTELVAVAGALEGTSQKTPPAAPVIPAAGATPIGTQSPAGETPPPSGSLIGAAAAAAGDGIAPNTVVPGAANDLVGAPEGYGVYKVPEGIQVDVAMVSELNDLAKTMNLSQVGAQKLIDLQVKMSQKQETAEQARWNEMKAGWETETKKALGASYDSEMAFVGKTMQRFATPGLLQLLADTGIGNHKEMVEFARTIGKAIAEDSPVAGAGASGTKSAADTLFDGKGS